MSDETETEPKAQTPFQFRIIHIICLTVVVALTLAIFRAFGFEKMVFIFGYPVLGVYFFAIIYYLYKVPFVFENYNGRKSSITSLESSLGFYFCRAMTSSIVAIKAKYLHVVLLINLSSLRMPLQNLRLANLK